MTRRCVGPCLIAFLLSLTGCGGGDLGSVTGTITLDEAPLSDALVMFNPIEGGRPSAARTDTAGKYELVYNRDKKGAEFGEHIVEITTGDELVQDDDTVKTIAEKVPKKYNFDSELTATVKKGAQEIDFALDSEGEIVAESDDTE